MARRAHAGQVDLQNQPYFGHLVRVMDRTGGDDTDKAIALLHDILEDTDVTEQTLRSEFGDTVADAVVVLTRRRGEYYAAYIARIATSGNVRAGRIKLADLADNTDATRGHSDAASSLQPRYEAAKHRLA